MTDMRTEQGWEERRGVVVVNEGSIQVIVHLVVILSAKVRFHSGGILPILA